MTTDTGRKFAQEVFPGYKRSKEFDQEVSDMMSKLDLFREMFEFVGTATAQESLELSPCAVWGMVELIKEVSDILWKVHCAQVFIEPPKEIWQDLIDNPSMFAKAKL